MQGAQTSSRYRGIGRYTLSLTKSLLQNNESHHIILLLNTSLPQFIEDIKIQFKDLIDPQDILLWQPPAFISQDDPVYIQAQLSRESFINALHPDLLLITSLFEGYLNTAVTSIKKTHNTFKTAIILYDLIPYIYQDHYLPTNKLKNYYFQKIECLKKADFYFAISSSSKQEAIAYLDIDPKKIITIHSAVDDIFKPLILRPYEKQQLLFRYSVKKHFILYVPGGFDYRKNFQNLLLAYAVLPSDIKSTYQLLIASKIPKDKETSILNYAASIGIEQDRLVLSGYIPDDDLVKLYSLTDLFVFPSLHEGFGLPLLEAMSCKAPCITSNTSSMPEVIQEPNLLFDPTSPAKLSELMLYMLTNETYLKAIQQLCYENSKKFSWQNTALTLLSHCKKHSDAAI